MNLTPAEISAFRCPAGRTGTNETQTLGLLLKNIDVCLCVDMYTQYLTLSWKQYTVVGIKDNFLPPCHLPSIWKWDFPISPFWKRVPGIFMEVTGKKLTIFFPSQVNMQRYFYEVKISAYFQDLNGILTFRALGEGCWKVCSQPAMKCLRPQELEYFCALAVLLTLNRFHPFFFKTLLDRA